MLNVEELEQRCVPSSLAEGFHFARVGQVGTVTGFDLATGRVLETFSFQLGQPAAPVQHALPGKPLSIEIRNYAVPSHPIDVAATTWLEECLAAIAVADSKDKTL